jgi:organic radical activating enzyme
MCCKTVWQPMTLGEDWFNSAELQERRLAHLNNVRHSSCKYCWNLEEANLKSYRTFDDNWPSSVETVNGFYNKFIAIKVGNICNMACRYCNARTSSIWAERLEHKDYNKIGVSTSKKHEDRKLILTQFYDWLNSEIQYCEMLILTGGEPTISPQFYDLIDNINIQNIPIILNTNMNMPKAYIIKLEKVLQLLAKRNNKITLRISLDGVEEQQSWQRQGSDWELIKSNYIRLSKSPVEFMISQTFTPLTLEGMPKLAKFLADLNGYVDNKPKFEDHLNYVMYPPELNPIEWLPSYKEEIQEFMMITATNNLINDKLLAELQLWIDLPNKSLSIDTVTRVANWLDTTQAKWGGGDWRTIYPKTTSIINDILTNSN